MFSRILKMRLKYYFREKTIVFWLMAFPLILATFFNIALRGILDGEALESMDVAVVTDAGEDVNAGTLIIKQALDSIEYFNITYTDSSEADRLLDDEKVTGVIFISAQSDGQSIDVSLKLKENGIEQTILKEVTDIIDKNVKAAEDIIKTGNIPVYNFDEASEYVKDAFKENNPPDTTVTFFYTVLAMACAYGAMTGVNDTEDIQANLSAKGMRQGLAPVPKTKLILAYFTSSSIAQCVSLSIVFVYIRYVLNINFGDRMGLIMLTTYIGAVAHVAIGTCIGAVLKCSTNAKVGLVIGLSMIGSFLAGMMSTGVKYSVYMHAPVVNYINTVNLVCDSYSKLYYYPGLKEYAVNMVILSAFGIAAFVASILVLRRQKYDSV